MATCLKSIQYPISLQMLFVYLKTFQNVYHIVETKTVRSYVTFKFLSNTSILFQLLINTIIATLRIFSNSIFFNFQILSASRLHKGEKSNFRKFLAPASVIARQHSSSSNARVVLPRTNPQSTYFLQLHCLQSYGAILKCSFRPLRYNITSV